MAQLEKDKNIACISLVNVIMFYNLIGELNLWHLKNCTCVLFKFQNFGRKFNSLTGLAALSQYQGKKRVMLSDILELFWCLIHPR